MCKVLGLQYAEWSVLSKTERARWIAYHDIERELERYALHETELKRLDVKVDDWLGYDENVREMKLAHAKELSKMERKR